MRNRCSAQCIGKCTLLGGTQLRLLAVDRPPLRTHLCGTGARPYNPPTLLLLQGWEQFTEAAISKLSKHHSGLVFLLWGRFAQVGRGQGEVIPLSLSGMLETARHICPTNPFSPNPCPACPLQEKERVICPNKHHILKCAHPSGLSASRGFFGCRHFSQTNALLAREGCLPIDWQIED